MGLAPEALNWKVGQFTGLKDLSASLVILYESNKLSKLKFQKDNIWHTLTKCVSYDCVVYAHLIEAKH